MTRAFRHQTRILSMILAASVLVPALVFAALAVYERGRVLGEADAALRRTVDILHEHALRLLEIQDVVIQQVDARAQGLGWDEMARSEDLHRFLETLDRSLEYVDAIWLIRPDGMSVAGSRRFPAKPVDVSDREHFLALGDGRIPFAVTRAVRDRSTGKPVFVVARRRTAPDGRFDGLIAVAIDAEKLLGLYRGVVPGMNHAVGLIRTDGVYLIRDAAVALPDGLPQMAGEAFRRASAGVDAGTYTGRSGIDGVRRIVGFRKVAGYPVHVVLALGVDAVLREWRQHMATYGALCAAAGLSLALLSLVALRQSRREREALERLEEEAARRETAEAALSQSQKLEAIGKLTGGIAHDFNNMLTAIIGSLHAIRVQAGPRLSELERPLERALQGADHAAALTRRLLAFARQQPINARTEDLNGLVRGMDELLRHSLGESVRLDIDLAPGLWLTACDSVQVETALLNLVINARDAMPGGGRLVVRTANVTLDAAGAAALGGPTPGEYVRLAVEDDGCGMPEEVRRRAFDPFFTTKPVGSGTGLGLSQVYGIVRQMGGAARIRSAPGAGTVVELFLPRDGGTVDAAPADPVPDLPAGPAAGPAAGAARILLVEDEALVRLVSAETLRGAGYEVVEAADATEAQDALAEADGGFDLLVTDIGLPILDGRRLAARARRLQPGLPVVFVTGHAAVTPGGDGSPGPGDRLLPKPFTPEALLRMVAEALAESRAAT